VAPCIVAGSARLELAVPAITKGGFYHAGQVCVSTQRIYVQESLHDILVDMLRESVGELVVGDASDAATDVGPLIRAAEVQRVHEWVEEAVSLGGKLALGGEPLGGNFYQPSILLDPPREARLSSQEVFGPVVCIYPYAELEQALDAANLHPHAFQASVFSENVSTVQAAFQRIHASALMINDHTAFRDDAMPFAGLDASGLGVGGIPYTIEDMQFEKMLVLKDGGN
jgi:acyl-CoA reductase-like NAD-dependent aldehyde dehydrogenase